MYTEPSICPMTLAALIERPTSWAIQTRGTRTMPVAGSTSTSATQDHLTRPLRSLNAGVPGHEGDATRVGAQVHGGEVGVAGDDGDVERIEPQHFRHEDGEDRVRALADLRRPTEHGDAAAAVA